MAGPYASVSNAFRQTTLAATYMSLIAEALVSTGSPYDTPQLEAFFTAYITTTYPLFVFLLPDLQAALARGLVMGFLSLCEDGYTLRPDMLALNPGNILFVAPRLSYGSPLITAGLQLPAATHSTCCRGTQRPCGGGSASSGPCDTHPITVQQFGCAPQQGCCAAPETTCCSCEDTQ